MEYSTGELARLSGLTSRALRWYDKKGLLIPRRTDEMGVRYYGQHEVDRLQQIMTYRALGFSLERIREILDNENTDRLDALRGQLRALEAENERISRIITAVKDSIWAAERNEIMSDEKKFEAFKKNMIDDNERKYGYEAREKYGDSEVDAANAALMNLPPEKYSEWERLGQDIQDRLERAVAESLSPISDAGHEVAILHREWLRICGGKYSPEKHRGIAQLYVLDGRFTAYYDKSVSGCAQFLRDAIIKWI